MEDEDGGLFNIEVSSDDGAIDESEKVPRDFQSEKDFQKQRREWKPKIEAGEVCSLLPFRLRLSAKLSREKLWKTLKLPIDNPSKPESQNILHAIEELYFFRRYEEAKRVVDKASKGKLIEEFRKTLEDYRGRCEAKLQKGAKG